MGLEHRSKKIGLPDKRFLLVNDDQRFNIRNHVLLIEYLSHAGRSKVVLYGFFALKLMKECLQALLPMPSGQNLKMIYKGFLDGIMGRFGGMGG